MLLQHVHCSHLGEIISFKLEKKTGFLSCVVQYFKTLGGKWDIDPDQEESTHDQFEDERSKGSRVLVRNRGMQAAWRDAGAIQTGLLSENMEL